MVELPIIVLAFANDQEGRGYLRDLPEELRRLQEILGEAERNGLCRLELLPNASLEQIFDVFTRNRDRVTIFHYAGHADSGRLLLESGAAGGTPANAAGLATFLGQRRGLQLVFLNGCSTRAQAARLLDAGVASVITTARAIDDGVAREFAAAFYTELASGAPLGAAYEASRGRVLAARGDAPKAYYRTRELGDSTADLASPDPSDDHGFPWEFRPGTELVERWSLPDAAGNPEFGLPRLPDRDLPESPFRHLAWFTAEHAEVFFGRGYQVRELYEQVADPSGPPILLLYGASGVGKSSLLDAGLVPRLETGGYTVQYRRRDQQRGLSGTLRDALHLAGDDASIAEGWHAEEARLGKPLVVFLDQVEEVFTRSAPAWPRELDDFLATLGEALGNREGRPRGRLVLGFRKEWLAEIDRRLAEAKLPRAKVFLKPLDRRGIIEAIRGPARAGRLQRQFRLSIEEGLPEAIAEDLLADAGSALAPTLQVLLTKMWERARQSDPEEPRFDRVLFETLKSQGYLLKDVLDEGLKSIADWDPAVAGSGLPLDLLAYHTTDLGTASQCTRAELDARYVHQSAALDGLLGVCKDRYLLLEADPPPDSAVPSTRLAHDLLAPLVQQRFRLSLAPGQRARRLLENRAPEWRDGKTGNILDRVDLAAAEAGFPGMRIRTEPETRLIDASRGAEVRRETQEKTRRRILRGLAVAAGVASIVAMIGGTVAWFGWRSAKTQTAIAKGETKRANNEKVEAEKQTGIANEKTEAAERAAVKEAIAAGIAKEKTQLAEERLKTATSRQLAALSESERNRRLDVSLLLGAEALQTANTYEARNSIYKCLKERPALAAFLRLDNVAPSRFSIQENVMVETIYHEEGNEGSVGGVAFTRNGKTLAAGYRTGRTRGGVALWDIASRSSLGESLPVHEGQVGSVAFSPDGTVIAAGYYNDGINSIRGRDGGVVLWDVASRTRLEGVPIPVKGANVGSVAFSPDGKTLAAGYQGGESGGGVMLWDLATRKLVEAPPLPVEEGNVGSVAFSPDGETLAAGFYDRNRTAVSKAVGGVVLWRVGTRTRVTDDPLPVKEGAVGGLSFSSNSTALAAGYSAGKRAGGGVIVWDLASGKRLPDFPLLVPEGEVWGADFSPDGKSLAVSYRRRESRGGFILWNVETRQRLGGDQFTLSEGEVWTAVFSPDGDTVAVGHSAEGGGGGVTLWDVTRREIRPADPNLTRLVDNPLTFKAGSGYRSEVQSIAFSPDGKTIAAAYQFSVGSEGGVALWDAASRKPLANPLIPLPKGQARSVAFSPDRKTLAAGYSSGTFGGHGGVRLWDVNLRPPLSDEPLQANEGEVVSVAFSPDGKILAAGWKMDDVHGGGGGVVLWSVAIGTRLPGDLPAVTRLAGDPLPVKVGAVESVAFSPDGKTLAVGGAGGVELWDVPTSTPPKGTPLPVKEGKVGSVAFSPDGRTLAAGYSVGGETGVRGGVFLWDLATRSPQALDLRVNEGGVTGVAVGRDPDGKTLVAASFLGYPIGPPISGVVVWDTASRQRLAGEPFLFNGASCVTFSPDGRTVAAGTNDLSDEGRVMLCDVNWESWGRRAGRIVNRNFTLNEWRQYFPENTYRRTFRTMRWPHDLPEEERKKAEAFEKQHPEGAARLESSFRISSLGGVVKRGVDTQILEADRRPDVTSPATSGIHLVHGEAYRWTFPE